MGIRDWYPTTMESMAAWWSNFVLRRADFGAKYPILDAEKTRLEKTGAWVAYWVDAKHAFDETSKQFTRYFATIAGNDASADAPTPPNPSLPPTPPSEVPPGIEAYIRGIRREVVGLTNYAKADGEALGFEAPSSAKPDPATVKPTIDVFGAASNYHFSIVVSKRGEATMWDVYTLKKGGSWTKADTCSGKSADVSVTPTTPGDAEQIQVRVQLRKNNADYGQPSDPAYVTVNP